MSLSAFYRTPDPLSPAPPGAVIRAQPLSPVGLPPGATAYRVLYHSTSLAGTDIAESGEVIIPAGQPPRSGYRIVSWAHGTTGLADACAPSRQGIASVPYLTQLLDDGYVIAATDYEGLGTAGVHPYLVGQSEGQSVLDAARAARNLLGWMTSDNVLVMGYSQGGQAALFAGQIAPTYAPELFLAGVVSFAPVANINTFAPATPTRHTDSLDVFAVASLDAWSATYGDLQLANLLTPKALALLPQFDRECISPIATAFSALPTNQVFRPGWEQSATLKNLEAQNDAGSAPTMAPILMVQGMDDTLITPSDTTALVDNRLCRQHDTLQYDRVAGAGHSDASTASQASVLQWITGRFDGRAAPDSCGSVIRSRHRSR